jgi:carboxyl-terminal processing protease
MIRRIFRRLAAVVAATTCTALPFASGAGCSAAPKAGTSAAARMPAVKPVETFDAVWTMVRDEHFDPTLNGVDWNAVRDELRPKAARAQSAEELRGVLMDMLSRLGQSHFTIIPTAMAMQADAGTSTAPSTSAPPSTLAAGTTLDSPRSGTTNSGSDDSGLEGIAPADPSVGATAAAEPGVPGTAGIDIALVEGEPIVLRVSPGLPAARAGVLVGWRLVSVDGARAADALAPLKRQLAEAEQEWAAGEDGQGDADSPHLRQLRAELAFAGSSLLSGGAGARREVVFADASGAEQRVRLDFEPTALGSTKFGHLPPFPIEVETRVLELPVDPASGGGKPVRIGVIAFNIWMVGASDAIDRAVDSMRSCDGIVLDLRGNPGGMGAMSMGVAGHFLREPASLGSMLGRDNTLEFQAVPRKVSTEGKRVRPYATKPLAILMDGRSASTSEVFAGGLQDLGRARVFGEPSAGMALPAQAKELPSGDVLLHAVADFVTSKGTRLEGRGVIPDEYVVPTLAELSRGEDPALAAASRWIRGSALASRAGKPNPPLGDLGSMPATMPLAMPPATVEPRK